MLVPCSPYPHGSNPSFPFPLLQLIPPLITTTTN